MFNHLNEMIVIQKQNEIEQNAKQAWKFEALKNKGTFQKVMQLIKASHTPTKSINDQRTCEVC
jgi:hypothetical protein